MASIREKAMSYTRDEQVTMLGAFARVSYSTMNELTRNWSDKRVFDEMLTIAIDQDMETGKPSLI